MTKVENHLNQLNKKHRELDEQIQTLYNSETVDDAEISRLKFEKLRIKDEIFAFKKQIANELLSNIDP